MAEEVVDQGTQPAEGQPAVSLDIKPAVTTEPAKPEPKVDEKKGKGEPEEIVYEATGDAKLDVALAFFGRAGVDVEHPAMQAAIVGDFSLLEAYLEEKAVPGWQAHIKLAQEAHAKFAEDKTKAEQAIVGAVSGALEKAGYSNEQWADAIGWARENADPDELAGLNEMLSKPFTAKVAVAYLTGLHREASGVEYTPRAKGVKEEAAPRTPAPADNAPITRVQFAQQAEKMAKSYGPDYMSTKEYKALRARVR